MVRSELCVCVMCVCVCGCVCVCLRGGCVSVFGRGEAECMGWARIKLLYRVNQPTIDSIRLCRGDDLVFNDEKTLLRQTCVDCRRVAIWLHIISLSISNFSSGQMQNITLYTKLSCMVHLWDKGLIRILYVICQ